MDNALMGLKLFHFFCTSDTLTKAHAQVSDTITNFARILCPLATGIHKKLLKPLDIFLYSPL